MRLSPETVYQYLYKRQLIDEASVIKGNFMVHPVKTRNNIMKILLESHNSLFVKQTADDTVARGLLLREVNAYNLISNNSEFAALAAIIPPMLDYDDEENVIVTRLLPNAKNLCEHYGLMRKFDIDIARGQAKILSAYHVVPKAGTDTSMFPKALPWVLLLDKFNADQFFIGNAMSTKTIQLIKDNYVLLQELKNLAASWQFTHLIHGDIKWINFLITEHDGKVSQTLIDWELADIGDPIWDVAGLLQSYIATWALGFDNNNPQSHDLPENMQLYNVKNTYPSAQAFLYHYMELQNYPEEAFPAFMIRAIQFTAARIIQTSIEGITYTTSIEANSMRCIQLAFNMLKDPFTALRELLNIQIQPAYV